MLHGGFYVQISTTYAVSQPNPLSAGKTEVTPDTEVQAKDIGQSGWKLAKGRASRNWSADCKRWEQARAT